MLYDPQQRPTVSQSLQYPYFQVSNAFPAPTNTAEPIPSTFTRRPVQKSEMEMRLDERAAAKQVQYMQCFKLCDHFGFEILFELMSVIFGLIPPNCIYLHVVTHWIFVDTPKTFPFLNLLTFYFSVLQMQEELERGQTFQTPVVNVLHEAAEAARTNSTYVQGRLAGEPRVGPPTNKPGQEMGDISLGALGGNPSSYHTSSTVTGDAESHAPTAAAAAPSVLKSHLPDTGFNTSAFGAKSGVKNAGFSNFESQTAGPTAASTAEGNNPASSSILQDPLASLLDGSEFSMAGINVGFPSVASNAFPAAAVGGLSEGPGVPKSKNALGGGGNYNFNAGNNNFSIDEEKSYVNKHSISNNLSGGQAAFDSYIGGDNK